MCELLNKFEALKSMIVLMGSYDFNFLSVEDLEEIEAEANELQIEITDFFEELDGMYNSDDRIYDIFEIWKKRLKNNMKPQKIRLKKYYVR